MKEKQCILLLLAVALLGVLALRQNAPAAGLWCGVYSVWSDSAVRDDPTLPDTQVRYRLRCVDALQQLWERIGR